MSGIIIFDGDNTLWDSNKVFKNAQLNLLYSLKKAGLRIRPNKELGGLREIDDLLVKYIQEYEYDFRILAQSLFLIFSGIERDKENAIRTAISMVKNGSISKASLDAYKIFIKEKGEVPPLFNSVKSTLNKVKTTGNYILMLKSEGEQKRIAKILNSTSLRNLFDKVIIDKKNKKTYERAKSIGISIWKKKLGKMGITPLIIVVGDILSRDIYFGNEVNAITIYKPGGYKGTETPKSKKETPNFTIRQLQELPSLIMKLESER